MCIPGIVVECVLHNQIIFNIQNQSRFENLEQFKFDRPFKVTLRSIALYDKGVFVNYF